MSFGFTAKNQFGFTQVDGVYQNLAAIYSGSIMCIEFRVIAGQSGGGSSVIPARSQLTVSTTNRVFDVSTISNFPSGADFLVFAKPSNSAASGTKNIGIHWNSATEFYFVKDKVTWDTSETDPTEQDSSFSVDFIVAVKSKDMPTNNNPDFGLRVRASNGDDIFNSNNQNFACKGFGYNTLPSTLFYFPTLGLQNMTDFDVDLSNNDIYADLTSKSIVALNSEAAAGYYGYSRRMHYLMHQWDYSNDIIHTLDREVNTRDPFISVGNPGATTVANRVSQVWGRSMFHLIGTFL